MGLRDDVSIPPNMPIDVVPEMREMYGEVNQKCAATESGLVDVGISRLLRSPELGPSVKVGRILVTAHQRPGDLLKEEMSAQNAWNASEDVWQEPWASIVPLTSANA